MIYSNDWNTRLHIYLVERDANEEIDDINYYNSFVIVCDSEYTARNTHPLGYDINSDDDYTYWIKPEQVNTLKVKKIGVAEKGMQKGVICTSFENNE